MPLKVDAEAEHWQLIGLNYEFETWLQLPKTVPKSTNKVQK